MDIAELYFPWFPEYLFKYSNDLRHISGRKKIGKDNRNARPYLRLLPMQLANRLEDLGIVSLVHVEVD